MKAVAALLIAVVSALLLPSPAYADGVAFKGDGEVMAPIVQGGQRAVILHEGGFEQLLIAISLELRKEDDAVWIFPVPGRPEQTHIDVADSFPQFEGVSPRERAWESIGHLAFAMRATQLYPMLARSGGIRAGGPYPMALAGGVEVHEQIEKRGVHAETVTTDSMDAFRSYLGEKKLSIPEAGLASFAPYLSKDFVLVLVWIASRADLLKEFPGYKEDAEEPARWPCLYVEFPTDRAFYPLRPTAGYGDARMPIDLWAIGYVGPATALSTRWGWSYQVQDDPPQGMPPRLAAKLPSGRLRYTHLYFHSEASRLGDDLWLKPDAPSWMWYAEVIGYLSHPLLAAAVWLLFTAGLSYVAAGASAALVYRKWREYACLGLWNLLTVVGFAAAVRLRKRQERTSALKDWGFILLFTCLFMILTAFTRAFLLSPLD